jgi:hypothetical protein
MSSRQGVIAGLSVLAFVAVAFVLFCVKSTIQASTINGTSMACMNEAKAHPNDRLAMDRCLKASGMLVEDSPPPGYPRPKPAQSSPPASYADCARTPGVVKYKPKTSSWASALGTCLENAGMTAVTTMNRNHTTGEIEYDIAH